MTTSTRTTGQEPGAPEVEALHTVGALLDPSDAGTDAAFRSGRARLAAEIGSTGPAVEAPPVRRGLGRGPATGRPGGPPRATGPRRRGLRLVAGLGVAATVAGGLLLAPTATLTMPWDEGGAPVPPGSASAAEILRAAATRTVTAADDSWDQVRDDQFVYWSTTGTSRYEVTGEAVTRSSEDYTGWYSVDGTQDGRATATYSAGEPLDERLFTCADGGDERARAAGTDCTSVPGVDRDAPTDVDAMYDYLRGDGDGSARSMFVNANDLLRTLTPDARAAVFGALSRVDGLVVTSGVTDAIGRPGIAVGVETADYRQDLIFDPETHDLLGSANAYPDGMTDGQAITGWSLVDKVGQTP
ncbi:CU044_5270 family protein [Promicromonospora sp. NPDC060204]|uniref:CU044_5270 family protein n=1 Tax=Promicromonospora sp. NPDC060204 TaxID=3347071 RepID=UPI003654486B